MSSATKQPYYELIPGAGSLERLEMVAPDGARAVIYLHGAHIVSWVPPDGVERLFLSCRSQFRAGAPIRGGVPVVFPQFGPAGPLPLHGLARLMTWEFAGSEVEGEQASALFCLDDTEESRRLWPHAFKAELCVAVGGKKLEITLSVSNTGNQPFDFTSSLHTYLRVDDVSKVAVAGLKGLNYQDATAGGIVYNDTFSQVRIFDEINRIYFDARPEVYLVDAQGMTIVRKSGFADTVVWNPGQANCARMDDLEPADYQRFVCIEAATVGVPTRLAPGECWEGSQVLEV